MLPYARRGKLSDLMDMRPGPAPRSDDPATQLSVPDEYRPAKSPDVLELDMGEGLILYNHDSSLVHHLNPSAALVWQLCEGWTTVRQLAGHIARDYELEPEEVRGQVGAVIAELDALDLLMDAGDLVARKDGRLGSAGR